MSIETEPTLRADVAERLEFVGQAYQFQAERMDPDVFVFCVDAVQSVLPLDTVQDRISFSEGFSFSRGETAQIQVAVLDALMQKSISDADGTAKAIRQAESIDKKIDVVQHSLLWDFFDGKNRYGSNISAVTTVAAALTLAHAQGYDGRKFLVNGYGCVYGNESYVPNWYSDYFGALDELAEVRTGQGELLTFGLNRENLADELLKAGQFETVARYPRSLGMNREASLFDAEVTKACMVAGSCASKGFNMRGQERRDKQLFSPIKLDADELAQIAAAYNGKLGAVQFTDLQQLMGLDEVMEALDAKQRAAFFDAMLDVDPAFGFSMYARYRKGILQAYEVFGPNSSRAAANLVDGIVSGDLTDEHTVLGITKKGKPGLDLLRTALGQTTEELLQPNKTQEALEALADKVRLSRIYTSIARAAFNFDDSQWRHGDSSDEAFLEVFERHANRSIFNDGGPAMAEHYQPSQVLTLSTYEKHAAGELRLPSEISQVMDLFPSTGEQVNDMTFRFQSGFNSLQKSIALSRSRQLTAKEMSDLVVKVVGLSYITENGQNTDFIDQYQAWGAQVSEYARALGYMEIVGHMTIDEALSELPEEDRNQLKRILKLDEVAMYMEQAENNTTYTKKGERQLQFIPNNDIGFDFAGDAGDACYTRQFDLGLRYPNMTAVLMCDRTNNQNKLIGSMILIEAHDQSTGHPILIMRAVNPRETWLKKMKDKEVLDELIAYSRNISHATGARLALVVDKPTGAATNRRSLFLEMSKLREGKQSITLDPDEVMFNNYKLEGSVYYID